MLVSLIGLEPILLSEGGFEPPASAIPPQGYLVPEEGLEPHTEVTGSKPAASTVPPFGRFYYQMCQFGCDNLGIEI